MRKQELIHLHRLLVEVGRYLDERDGIPPDACDAYVAGGVAPTDIHRSKRSHYEAVTLLMDGLCAAIAERSTDPEAAPSSSNHSVLQTR